MTSWWPAAAATTLLVVPYVAGVLARPAHLRPWSRLRTTSWVLGAVLVGAALSPPLAGHARHDHGAHMAQHLLLGMYAPLGLVLAAPLTLLLGSAPRHVAARLTRVLRTGPLHALGHPASAATLSTGGLLALYLTPLYEAARADAVVHGAVLAHLLLAGCLYTWAIAGPDPAPRRPRMPSRLAALVVAAGTHAFLAKLLYARATAPTGGAAEAGQPSGHMVDLEVTGMADAARAMYYGGDVAELLLAVALFSWWYRRRAVRNPPGEAAPLPGTPTSSSGSGVRP